MFTLYLYALDCKEIIYCGQCREPHSRIKEHLIKRGANLTVEFKPISIICIGIFNYCESLKEANLIEKEFACHIASQYPERIISIGPRQRVPPIKSFRNWNLVDKPPTLEYCMKVNLGMMRGKPKGADSLFPDTSSPSTWKYMHQSYFTDIASNAPLQLPTANSR